MCPISQSNGLIVRSRGTRNCSSERSRTISKLCARASMTQASSSSAEAAILPTDRLSFDLLIEPCVKRLEVIQNGGCVHLSRAGNLLQSVRPGTGEAH